MERDIVKEKLPQIIEYFVKFYGEPYRQRITDRLNNTFFCYGSFSFQESLYAMKEFDAGIKTCVREILSAEFATKLSPIQAMHINSFAVDFFKIIQKTDFGTIDHKGLETFYKIFRTFGIDVRNVTYNEVSKWYLDMALSSRKIRQATLLNVVSNNEDKVYDYVLDYYKKTFPNMDFDDILGGRDSYISFVVGSILFPDTAGGTFISCPYNDTSKVKSLCYLPEVDNLCDNVVIHELNHIFYSDVFFQDNRMVSKTGLIRTEYDVDLANRSCQIYQTDNEKATAFEEVINDFHAQKIMALMRKDNFRINEQNQIVLDAIYTKAFPVLSKFFNKYKAIIVQSRTDGKIKDFKNLIGKEKYQKLVEYVGDFIEFAAQVDTDEIEKEIASLGADHMNDFSPLAKRYFNYLISISDQVADITCDNESDSQNNSDEENEIY